MHENGERCSEYFCKLEKKSSINKTISELINEKGNHISEQSKFYLNRNNITGNCIHPIIYV